MQKRKPRADCRHPHGSLAGLHAFCLSTQWAWFRIDHADLKTGNCCGLSAAAANRFGYENLFGLFTGKVRHEAFRVV
jgi:hypothetical protein